MQAVYLQDHHAAQISTPVMQQKLRFEGFICKIIKIETKTGCIINTESIIESQITNPILYSVSKTNDHKCAELLDAT